MPSPTSGTSEARRRGKPVCHGPRTTVELLEGKVDWEAEPVAVVGRYAHRVSEHRAWESIAELMVGQDLPKRVVQLAGKASQFGLGKSFPGLGPTGPVLVTPDEFDDLDDLEVTGPRNGDAFPVPLIARLSAVVPLLPGDLVFTGSPAGVGNRMNPLRHLAEDDEMISRIEGIGETPGHRPTHPSRCRDSCIGAKTTDELTVLFKDWTTHVPTSRLHVAHL